MNIKDKKKVEKTLSKINSESNSNFFDVIIDDGSHYLSDILNQFPELEICGFENLEINLHE